MISDGCGPGSWAFQVVDESNDAQYTFSRIEGDGRDTASIGEGNTDGSKPGLSNQ